MESTVARWEGNFKSTCLNVGACDTVYLNATICAPRSLVGVLGRNVIRHARDNRGHRRLRDLLGSYGGGDNIS